MDFQERVKITDPSGIVNVSADDDAFFEA